MPHGEFEQYLADFRPLPPDPLPRPARRLHWPIPVALAAALALAVWLLPRSQHRGPATGAFTLGQANQLLLSEKPWRKTLDDAAFSGPKRSRGNLEYLTPEELKQ
jgi:hypothetical protein